MTAATPLLAAEDLRVTYRTRRGPLVAIDGVSLSVAPGEAVGLVGESGCGKSSLVKAIFGLAPVTDGDVRIQGRSIVGMRRTADRRALARQIQMVFQNPAGSLDPRCRIGDSIAEPLRLHRFGSRADIRARLAELMAQVGLQPELAERLPHKLSGGQRQRACIARALSLRPELIIFDEAVSALDVSMQAQVINLLNRLKRETGVAILFISHDIAVVEHISDRIAVMYLGKIVEVCGRGALVEGAAHPYTRALISAIPRTDPRRSRLAQRPVISGDQPSPFSPPSGCRFRTRCQMAQPRCADEEPRLRAFGDGRLVACHFVGTQAAAGSQCSLVNG